MLVVYCNFQLSSSDVVGFWINIHRFEFWILRNYTYFPGFCSVQTSEESKLKFSEDEETLIIRMYNLVEERWALIAGRISGRIAEEIEEYCNTRYSTSD
ncbi:transcription factor CPC-like [Durio zibethinus]|uniref:Transcription factor CPC-like n=1 Tax=Durio zibethinus TaxID=66656 RepID=A0A6P5X5A2_DURZI|nr:transcription factor CPC-like [Durio zibethinus]